MRAAQIVESSPKVSVVIPCRNERRYIRDVIDSVLRSDQPEGEMEILIVDGMSDDGTRDILRELQAQHPSLLRILDNPKRITPCALNLGVRAARGEVIVRLDAHTYYEKDYFVKCTEWLERSGADNVGGVWIVEPTRDTVIGRALARSYDHPFGSGSAHYRTGTSKEPRYVDTVPFGCYRRQVFDRIGYFREDLARSQDMEFNIRLRNAGGKILLVPEIKARYQARATLAEVLPYYLSNGFWVLFPLKFGLKVFKFRHLAPLAFTAWIFVFGLLSLWSNRVRELFLLCLAIYSGVALLASIHVALRQRRLEYVATLPAAFAFLHLTYGIGSVYGGLCLILERLMPGQFPKATPTQRV
jgi:glycosyltransferase involved in cell wall biosynthesis